MANSNKIDVVVAVCAASSKLNYLAGRVALIHRSTFIYDSLAIGMGIEPHNVSLFFLWC